MYNKVLAIICSIVLVACDNTQGLIINILDDEIKLVDENKRMVNLQLRVGEQINCTYPVMTNDEFSILEALKSNKEFYNDIALLFAQNNSEAKLNLKVPGAIDTTFIFHWDVGDVSIHSSNVIQGKCAKLVGGYDTGDIQENIIRWLYRNNCKNVGDETVNKMRLYLQELNRTDYKEYITNEEIPVLKSFQGINYKISSDVVADNYYLLACGSEEEIEKFVEDMVAKRFEGAVHSLEQTLSCYCSPDTSGTICVFLVGINNDWNYKISPIGLVCIDNVKPSNTFIPGIDLREKYHESIVLDKNKIKVKMPSELPSFEGYAILDTRDWGGNGISCNVNFEVIFSGDVKSITLIREGHLAEWLGKGKKVVDLQAETSPYLFTYELHLEDGDNYVPIILTDIRGNETKFKFNVACESKPINSPQINIDNNVNVY